MQYLKSYFVGEFESGKITELEHKVLQYIEEYYNPEDDHGHEFKSIANDLNIAFNSLKGVISSLSKKEYIFTDDWKTTKIGGKGKEVLQWVYASDKYRNLWLEHEEKLEQSKK